MAVYLIAYDLVNEKKKSFDYEPLWGELKRLGCHRTQYSLWLGSFDNKPTEIRKHFQKFMDSDDRILVTRLRKGEYDYANAIVGTNKWLESNPPD